MNNHRTPLEDEVKQVIQLAIHDFKPFRALFDEVLGIDLKSSETVYLGWTTNSAHVLGSNP